jgi:hypothetical protein
LVAWCEHGKNIADPLTPLRACSMTWTQCRGVDKEEARNFPVIQKPISVADFRNSEESPCTILNHTSKRLIAKRADATRKRRY